MKKKELKDLAKKIAMYEQIIQSSEDENEINQAKYSILALSDAVSSLDDIAVLDEIIQDLMK